MPSEADKRELFDSWADTYDLDVPTSTEFPLAGYEKVHTELLSLAEVESGMSILDLGTGTGNLLGLFLERDCSVWATDFSPRMIERARAKYPKASFLVADIQDDMPASFPKRYDRIVSAYVFHHLELDEKARLIQDLALKHLLPRGRLLIADVAFPIVQEREVARSRFEDRWDPGEYYWAADETKEMLHGLSLEIDYVQVSFCAGIFVIWLTNDASGGGK